MLLLCSKRFLLIFYFILFFCQDKINYLSDFSWFFSLVIAGLQTGFRGGLTISLTGQAERDQLDQLKPGKTRKSAKTGFSCFSLF